MNQTTAYKYDHRGNLAELTNPKGDSYRFEYDPAGRLIKETDYLGQVKTYTLDPSGNLTAKVDFNGSRTDYNYDKLNRMIVTAFPDGTKKSFSYDPVGNLTSAANNLVTEKFYYDELSRLVKAETIGLIENETKLVEFGYDKAGNTTAVITKENGAPRKVSYAYDGLNRLAKVTLPDGGNVKFKYDALNRVTERSNSNRTGTAYTYTTRNEVESIINYQDQRRGPDNVLSSYGYIYNAKGQRIFQVEGDGEVTAYNYDPAGRIKEVYYPFADAKKTEDLKERFYYGLLPDPQEHFKIRHRVPGLRYDEQESLEKQILEFTDSLMDKDDNGNHKGNKHGKGKEIEIECSPKRPFVSRLDLDYQNRNKIEELHRQIREGHGRLDLWKGFWKEEYDYDPNGNITQKRNGWGEIDYQYNLANRMTQVGNRAYQYDPNGNLTKEVLGKFEIDYQYNHENRLIKADSLYKHSFLLWPIAGEVSYGYDALGRKVKKEQNPAHGPKTEVKTEYYIYNGLGLDILADYKYQVNQYWGGVKGELSEGNEYYYGNGLLLASGEIQKPQPYQYSWGWNWNRPQQDINFYHHDVLGSVVMLTDKNGWVKERNQYDIWGKAYDGRFVDRFPGCGNGSNDNVYGFTGQRYQPELGVYSFAYRDYSPRTMRWMTEDPVKDGGNWYLYCGGDPVNWVDLLGLDTVVLDPGHGGTETGSQGAGLVEKDVNLEIASEVADIIDYYNENFDYDIDVVMTRTTDTNVSLDQRYETANKVDADAFVSIHTNSSNPVKSGESIVTPANHDKDKSFDLAYEIYTNSVQAGVKQTNDPIYEDTRGLAVLNGTEMPAVLVEVGYIIGDSKSLKNETYKDNVAWGIAHGIMDYLNKNKDGCPSN